MKNTPITYINERAKEMSKYAHGVLLMRNSTILAGVLARLLEGGMPLTVWEGVDAFRTTGLTSAIRTLKKKYGWPIESIVFPTFMPDGIFYVKGYKLPQAAIDHAYQNLDADFWIEMVKVEQVRKRAINEVKAAALNSYRFIIDHPDECKDDQHNYRRWVGL